METTDEVDRGLRELDSKPSAVRKTVSEDGQAQCQQSWYWGTLQGSGILWLVGSYSVSKINSIPVLKYEVYLSKLLLPGERGKTMSQTLRTRSIDSAHGSSQHAMEDVQDTASSSVRPASAGPLPGMSQYTETHAPNTVFARHDARSPTRPTSSTRRSRPISPLGISIAQRRAQLAANLAASAASGVGQVAASVDATRNVAETALATATATQDSIEETIREHVQQTRVETSQAVDDVVHRLATEITAAASGSVATSEAQTREIVQGLREELQRKFNEDRVAEDTRRGQLDIRLNELSAGIEQLNVRMNENQPMSETVIHGVERGLQQQIHDRAMESQNVVQQLSQKVDVQSKSMEDTAVAVRNLLLQLEELNKNFGSVQADIARWKANEEQAADE